MSDRNLFAVYAGDVLPSNLARRLWLVVPAGLCVVLAFAQLVLDLARVPSDPVLSDAFKLALGSLLASIAVDRSIYSGRDRKEK